MSVVIVEAAWRPRMARSRVNSSSSSDIAHGALNRGSSGMTTSPPRNRPTLAKRTPGWRTGSPGCLASVALTNLSYPLSLSSVSESRSEVGRQPSSQHAHNCPSESRASFGSPVRVRRSMCAAWAAPSSLCPGWRTESGMRIVRPSQPRKSNSSDSGTLASPLIIWSLLLFTTPRTMARS